MNDNHSGRLAQSDGRVMIIIVVGRHEQLVEWIVILEVGRHKQLVD